MKKEKEVNRNFKISLIFILAILVALPFVSAGVGIKWDKESSFVPENTRVCMTYQIYNPWPQDSYAQIQLTGDIEKIIASVNSEIQFIPHDTSSANAIPVQFCFKTPKIYQEDCALFSKLICKQDCKEEMKMFEGDVNVVEVPGPSESEGGVGGSATKMSVSAPIRVRVACEPHSRNYSVVYIVVGAIALVLLLVHLAIRKNRKKK
jgi:hypothetical protein